MLRAKVKTDCHTYPVTDEHYRLISLLKRRINIFILFFSILIYTIVWSYISIEKYLALNASVYDLGFSMQNLWFVTHEIKTYNGFLSIFATKGILLILAPLYYVMSPSLLLIIQSTALALGALPIYGLSARQFNDKKIATILSVLYLIYFPMSGVNWFDFHFQMFFVILFLSAYYFYETKHFSTSTIFFILSGLVRYPYYIFPLLFSVLIIIQNIIGSLNHRKKTDEIPLTYALILFAFMSFLAIAQLLFVGGVSGISKDVASNGVSFNGKTVLNGLTIFFYMLFPLIFLPLLSKRWVWFMIPFAFLMFTSDSFPYVFPFVFQLQYPSAILPFIWLGLIDVLSKFESKLKGRQLMYFLRHKFGAGISSEKIFHFLSFCIIFLVISSAMFFEPYGPLNGISNDNFHIASEISVNESQLNMVDKLISLIPPGNPFVYVQDNLPQAMIHHFSEYVMSLYIPSNLSEENISTNQFPYYYGGNVKIDYVLGDTNNYLFYVGSPSMEQFVKQLYDSGYYQIIGGGYGIFLMERIPVNSTTFFRYYNINIHPSEPTGWPLNNAMDENASGIRMFNVFQSYSDYILPGSYVVTLGITAPRQLSGGNLIIQMTDAHHDVLVFHTFNLNGGFEKINFQFDINITNFFSSIYLEALVQNLSVPLYLSSIEFEQMSVYTNYTPIPTTTYSLLRWDNSTTIAFSDGNVFIHNSSMRGKFDYFWRLLTANEYYNNSVQLPYYIILSTFGTETIPAEMFISNITNDHHYGMIFVNSEIEVLELNFNSTYQQVIVTKSLFPALLFDHYSYISQGKNDLEAQNLTSNDVFFFGPYIFLPHGRYKVTFLISSSNTSTNDGLYLNIFSSQSAKIINGTEITNRYIGTQYSTYFISVNFDLEQNNWGVQFRGMNLRWYGDIFFYGLLLNFCGT
jgi:uncharacterized membrane protein